MLTLKNPPFYENWDNMHCSQCCLRSILEAFEPKVSWTWDELDILTGKVAGKPTWPQRAQINMVARGYEVVSVSHTSPAAYLKGDIYEILVEKLGREVADFNRIKGDLDGLKVDMEAYAALMDKGLITFEERPARMSDVERLLAEGFMVMSTLNARALNDREGYSGHVVLVYGLENGMVKFHDSGLPGIEGREVSREHFIMASENPNENQWKIYAFRRPVA